MIKKIKRARARVVLEWMAPEKLEWHNISLFFFFLLLFFLSFLFFPPQANLRGPEVALNNVLCFLFLGFSEQKISVFIIIIIFGTFVSLG